MVFSASDFIRTSQDRLRLQVGLLIGVHTRSRYIRFSAIGFSTRVSCLSALHVLGNV